MLASATTGMLAVASGTAGMLVAGDASFVGSGPLSGPTTAGVGAFVAAGFELMVAAVVEEEAFGAEGNDG